MFDDQSFYEQVLFLSIGKEERIIEHRLIAAGNINQGVYLQTQNGFTYFLKVNFQTDLPDIFEKEAQGLSLMQKKSPLKVPDVYRYGTLEERNYLLMEWIPGNRPKSGYWEELGVGLAQMHMATRPAFGLDSPNFIASIVQYNKEMSDWTDFFIQQRLEVLIGKAYYEHLIDKDFLKSFQSIYPKLEGFFPKEKPALLHGDLWSGNIMHDNTGAPVLIDPAVYYGHREMDLAFSRLFGGFDASFYQAYMEVFPLEPGFEERVPVYNLYPLLVHLLLFGQSYLSAIQRTVRHLS